MKENRTAIVTGGTAGLGKALVEILLGKKWNVATFGRRPDLVRALIKETGSDNLLAESCDLTNQEQVSVFLEKAQQRFGSPDLLVLNAGELGPTPLKPIREWRLLDFRLVFEANFFSNLGLIQHVLRTHGTAVTIVHVTSDAAANNYPGWAAYSASKAAMDHLIRTLQVEEKGGSVRAFSFDPGDMDTEMHRKALPQDKPESLKRPTQSAEELFEEILRRERSYVE